MTGALLIQTVAGSLRLNAAAPMPMEQDYHEKGGAYRLGDAQAAQALDDRAEQKAEKERQKDRQQQIARQVQGVQHPG